MPGIARHTPQLTGAKAARLIIADAALLSHLGELIAQLTRDDEWLEVGSSIADVLEASWEALNSWYGGHMIGQVASFVTIAPPGWLALDGSTHAEDDYPELFAKLPAAWIAGTNFTLPDVQDTFLAGAGALGTIAGTGGANSYALTAGQLPAHSHSYQSPVLGAIPVEPGPPVPAVTSVTPTQTGNAGSGEQIDNRPDFLVVTMAVYAGRV